MLYVYEDRSAKVTVLFGYFDGEKLKTYSGEIDGTVVDAPRGDSGFPSDTIFVPEGHGKTWAEMTAEEQSATSIRRMALKKLELNLRR